MAAEYPPRAPGRLYLTEAGIETEVLYKMGYDLPAFAMFPLLENPQAMRDIRDMYRRQLDVAAEYEMIPAMAEFGYRASPDWAAKIGYSNSALKEAQIASIAFLRELYAEYDAFPEAYAVGSIGPRGDAYGTGGAITAAEAEDYHAVQIGNLKAAGADMGWAMTFNNVPEAIGVARAAGAAGLPLAVSFSLADESRLKSGPTLKEAIEETEAAAGENISFFAINCSHPVEFEPALDGGSWEKRIRNIRPNASAMEKIALCKLGHLEDGDPEELGHQIATVAGRMPWMDIFGGCCGSDERHLREIARQVKELRAEESDLFDDVPV